MIPITKNTWGVGRRIDLIAFEHALELGYTAWSRSKPIEGIPFDSLSYVKDNRHIWFCQKGWACADLIDGYYRNHRYYGSLTEALETEAECETTQS